jgi:hypothetical protein
VAPTAARPAGLCAGRGGGPRPTSRARTSTRPTRCPRSAQAGPDKAPGDGDRRWTWPA